MGAVLDAGSLVEVVWVSLVAGIGVTAIYSLALYGGARSAELRRRGQGRAAAAVGAVGVIAGIAFVLGVALAVRLLILR
ncbi:MAG TPA: hypothetical protein VF533_20680 [Solirubrobacteraceae bacterium]